MRAGYLITVSFLVLSLQSVCLAQGFSSPVFRGAPVNQLNTGLNRTAMMFYEGKSQQEVLNAWGSYVKANPRMNVTAAISSLQQQVRQIGEDKVQKARIREDSVKRLGNALREELNLTNTFLQNPGGLGKTGIRRKTFTNTGTGSSVIEGEAITTPEMLKAYNEYLQDILGSVRNDAQLAQFDLQKVYQDYQRAVQTIADIQKTMHDDAMTIINNLK